MRGLRSVLNSMEKLFRKNRHLEDTADPPDGMHMVTVQNRITHWLNSTPVGPAAARLNEAVQTDSIRHFDRSGALCSRLVQDLGRHSSFGLWRLWKCRPNFTCEELVPPPNVVRPIGCNPHRTNCTSTLLAWKFSRGREQGPRPARYAQRASHTGRIPHRIHVV